MKQGLRSGTLRAEVEVTDADCVAMCYPPGYLFLKKLAVSRPARKLTVFSFQEDAWEPCFVMTSRN